MRPKGVHPKTLGPGLRIPTGMLWPVRVARAHGTMQLILPAGVFARPRSE